LIDLHTHTLFSDGELLPSELARRAQMIGYRFLAITDHVDVSNFESVVTGIVRFCSEYKNSSIKVLPGAEITHVPPDQYKKLVERCRELGAKVVVAHGETIVEPVQPGTNRAAIEAGVDIIAHPGLISGDDASLAAEKGVALEISGRGGHSFTNGHVAALARKHGAKPVFCTDAHKPSDLMDRATAESVSRGAGMEENEINSMFGYAESLVARLLKN